MQSFSTFYVLDLNIDLALFPILLTFMINPAVLLLFS